MEIETHIAKSQVIERRSGESITDKPTDADANSKRQRMFIHHHKYFTTQILMH